MIGSQHNYSPPFDASGFNLSSFDNDLNFISLSDLPPDSDNQSLSVTTNNDGVTTGISISGGNSVPIVHPDSASIPTNLSSFNNDSNFITLADLPADLDNQSLTSTTNNDGVTTEISISGGNSIPIVHPTIPSIPVVPTNLSSFDNDLNFITLADLPADSDSQSLSVITDNDGVTVGISISGGNSIPIVQPAALSIPTNLSSFNNDSGFITSADLPADLDNQSLSVTTDNDGVTIGISISGGNSIPIVHPSAASIPTNLSSFSNDTNFITLADLPADLDNQNLSTVTDNDGVTTGISISGGNSIPIVHPEPSTTNAGPTQVREVANASVNNQNINDNDVVDITAQLVEGSWATTAEGFIYSGSPSYTVIHATIKQTNGSGAQRPAPILNLQTRVGTGGWTTVSTSATGYIRQASGHSESSNQIFYRHINPPANSEYRLGSGIEGLTGPVNSNLGQFDLEAVTNI